MTTAPPSARVRGYGAVRAGRRGSSALLARGAVRGVVHGPVRFAVHGLAEGVQGLIDVDPTYKAGWEFPGGVVEPGEAPARGGMREVTEETGIRLQDVPRLLVVDWERPEPPRYGGLRLLFDGGRLDSTDAERLVLPGPELREWRFVTETEAADLLPPVRYERLRWALRARERGTALYLEAGTPAPS